MPTIAEKLRTVSPSVAAAHLLVARALCEAYALPVPMVAEIIAVTKASRSSAYELVDVFVALLPTLSPTRGRPPKPAVTAVDESKTLTRVVLGYVMRHPGCVYPGAVRQLYSDDFRRFIVELRVEHATTELEVFAEASNLPLGTIKDWLRSPVSQKDAPAPTVTTEQGARMQTVLEAWPRWKGSFLSFCEHVREELRVPFGRDLVSRILEVHGLRYPARRAGRPPDESALRGAFRTYFPGAQWVGDGMQVPVAIDGQRFDFNLELNVDAHTDAFVGVSVRQEEDAAAVVEAFHDGVLTTGDAPLSLLLDNRPSNHTPEVDLALGDTTRIRATVERPQNKAHVEGAFGLFSQVLPELVLDTQHGPQALAMAFLAIVAQVWAHTTNHRPRAARGGRSRAEMYSDQPSDEQIEQARRELRETAERQERARRTLEARRRPDVLLLLDSHFARLDLLDPQRNIRLAIAGYPLDAIVDGIAIFESKRLAHTLPDGVDARYLLGIVRNLAAQTEGEHLARRLFALRLEVGDTMLASLVATRVVVCSGDNVLAECVERALATSSPLERTFWLDSLADVIRSYDQAQQQQLFCRAARRIHATFAITPRERHNAVRVLADRTVPLA